MQKIEAISVTELQEQAMLKSTRVNGFASRTANDFGDGQQRSCGSCEQLQCGLKDKAYGYKTILLVQAEVARNNCGEMDTRKWKQH